MVGLVYRQGDTVLASYAWTYSGGRGDALGRPVHRRLAAQRQPRTELYPSWGTGTVAAGPGLSMPVAS